MASSLRYHRDDVQQATTALAREMRKAARKGMQAVMDKAAEDARAIANWRDPGRYEVDYPSGRWSWEVTGMAKASIVGYVVPDKRLPQQARMTTTSYHNGAGLTHPHYTDDGVTGSYADNPDVIQGILTMNVAYAPYLQEHEIEMDGEPATVDALEMNWARVYVPNILVPAINRALDRVASIYS